MSFDFTTYKIIDLSILAVLLVLLTWFLIKHKSNLKKDGILVLYRTKLGIKLIDKIGGKYKKTLKVLTYVSITLGYLLMVGMTYLLGKTIYLYITKPAIVQAIKAPPLMPLIPYFPELFGLKSFFPTFYVVYFIVAILIAATIHEFSHGIFAKFGKVRIKSTGFAFLKFFPAIFGAFVEQDDKQMNKKSIKTQLAILSAGVFANIIVTVVFFILLIIYFSLAFNPIGVTFNNYMYSGINISQITSINGVPIHNPSSSFILDNLNITDYRNLTRIVVNNNGYFLDNQVFINNVNQTYDLAIVYNDLPAIRAGLPVQGVITSIDNNKITSAEDFSKNIQKFKPGENTIFEVKINGEIKDYNITFADNGNGKAVLGVYSANKPNFLIGEMNHFLVSIRPNNLNLKDNVYYEPKLGEFTIFIYYLLWWVVLINLLIALFNMLPLGILDGGRFFQLTVLKITRSEKVANWLFKFITYLILIGFLALMVRWAIGLF
ncbi:MAG: site-2 protease family protein [Candidatus Pacearchaeota archaeon]|jgi:membrane-associated protease RseP (regulator of RpoE activity)